MYHVQRLFRLAVQAAVLVLIASPVFGQANVDVNAGIQFDFSNPGARSLGMGGAYRGVSDDATGAFTNPAGLKFLLLPEASIEIRYRGYATPFTQRGHVDGSPTMIRYDTVAGLMDGTSNTNATGVSFMSFVYPKGRWRFAAYRHEQTRFTTSVQSDGPFSGEPARDNEYRLFPYTGTLDLSIVGYGASVAAGLGSKLSVGFGVTAYQFSIDSLTRRFDFVRTDPDYYNAPNFADSNQINQQTQKGSGTKAAVTVGVAWTPTEKIQVGAVYHQGAKFGYTLRNEPGPRASFTATDTAAEFTMPDMFSMGTLIKVSDPLKIAVDYSFVRYSKMMQTFVSWLQAVQASDYVVDDANEFHLGAEYGLLSLKHPLFLRAGIWWDPDHAIRYVGSEATQRALFAARSGQTHGSIGAGMSVNRKLEINAGFDFSTRVKTASASAVVRF